MIRDAKEDDSRAIANIIVSAWQHAYDGVIDPDHPGTMKPERYIDIMETNIREKREKILVWEENGIIVGFISGRLLKEKAGAEGSCGAGYGAEVVGLYIRPEFQGSGIGSRLLTEMKAFFRRRGCGRLIIWTLLGVRNNEFYLKHGGSPLEHKDLEIGGKSYRGVGFVFNL